MKKWIRWPGLITFIILLILISSVLLLIVDPLIKRAIEQYGTRAVTARVDLESADLSLFPLGLTLLGLQVTNPDKPMTNAIEISNISFNIDTLNLFRRKLIIDNMALNGVRINTARKSSGAIIPVVSTETEAEKKSTFEMPSLDIPDVKEILAKEKLHTLEEIKNLQSDISTMQKKWNDRFKDLPNKSTFEQYRDRINDLKGKGSGGLKGALGSAGEIAEIRKDITRSMKLIENADKEFSADLSSLKKRGESIKKAPEEDIDRLVNKYSLTPGGVKNMGMMLFGPKVSSYMNTAFSWYEKLKPFMNRRSTLSEGTDSVTPLRGKGIDIRFKEEQPLPDLLIRAADVSLILDAGDLKGRITNITPDQDILREKTGFLFSGDNLKGLKSVQLDGSLDYINPEMIQGIINTNIKGYRFRDISISDNASLPISFSEGLADLDGNASLNGEKINSSITAGLHELKIITGNNGDESAIARALSSALESISSTDVRADITGTIQDYQLNISSDLDNVLKESLGSEVKKQTASLKKNLSEGVMAKVSGPIENAQSSLSGLDGIGSELTSRLNMGNGLLKDSAKGGIKLPF